MATDPAAQADALRATIASCQSLLDSGTTQMAENGRMMRFDLDVVRQQRDIAVSQLAALTGVPRPIRRIYPTLYRRGY